MSRVLIVEPHPDVRESFAAVCETWGHDVVTAADGEEALVLVAAFKPDIVLLDVGRRRGVDGAMVARRIRQVDGDRVFIIALTGWMPVSDRAGVLRGGANAFFLKPPDLDQVRKTIDRAGERLTKHGN